MGVSQFPEIHHSRIGEKERLVAAGDERHRGHNRMATRLEEIEIRLPDLCAGHAACFPLGHLLACH